MIESTLWQFSGSFRGYQQRILDRPKLLDDHKLHIVAAPGSGKTILGLEVAGRLGKQTLTLSPSLAIRDQWLERLRTHFVPTVAPDNLSVTLSAPGLLTSITYQSLFAAYSRTVDEETGENFESLDILDACANVGTIILDEAHHLRTQWHRALTQFIAELRQRNSDLHIISLTATPPYESTPTEWARYIDLCGDIDEEISIPELVGTKDLCPHQDFIYIAEPTAQEVEELRRLRLKTYAVISRIQQRPKILKALAQSPVLQSPEEYFDECLDDERGCVGVLHLLDAWGIAAPENLAALLAEVREEGTVEDGFSFMLSHPSLVDSTAYEAIRDELRAERLVRGNKLINTSDLEANTILVRSAGKLNAIGQIAVHEASALGKQLRMLVLVDHIRANYLSVIGTEEPLVQLGAVPAFEAIRRSLAKETQNIAGQSVAMLTGSCVLLPRPVVEGMKAEFPCSTSDLPNCADYVQVSFSGGSKQAVKAVTRAVECGQVTILVGTASLLGEGWDCPALNTLILGSTIKATMMTNQMRGRVIRVDAEHPDKVANIWHLGTSDPTKVLNPKAPADDLLSSFDLRMLAKRCQTFVGPRMDEPIIENGFERCLYSLTGEEIQRVRQIAKKTFVRDHNSKSLTLSHDRAQVRRVWDQALSLNSAGAWSLNQQVDLVPSTNIARVIGAAEGFIALAVGSAAYFVSAMVQELRASVEVLWFVGVLALICGVVGGVLWWFKGVLFGPQRRIRRQSMALFDALRECGFVSAEHALVSVVQQGDIGCAVQLLGASDAEQRTFATAVYELNGVVRNPRYVLIPDVFGLPKKVFFAQNVPSVLAANKEQVEVFVRHLRRHGVRMKAEYVRSVRGRELLLAARRHAANNRGASARRKRQILTATKIYGTRR